LGLANRGGFASEHKKRCLEHILGVLHMTQQAAAQPQHQRTMPRYQCGKRLLIALMDEAFQQLAIVAWKGLAGEPAAQMS
jgi:hypothetical protein